MVWRRFRIELASGAAPGAPTATVGMAHLQRARILLGGVDEMSILLRCPQHLKNRTMATGIAEHRMAGPKLGNPERVRAGHRILVAPPASSRSRASAGIDWASCWPSGRLGEQWDTGISAILTGCSARIELEPQARLWYEMAYHEVAEVGFMGGVDESKLAGCSPDGLVGDDEASRAQVPLARLARCCYPDPQARRQLIALVSTTGRCFRLRSWASWAIACVRHHELSALWLPDSCRASEACSCIEALEKNIPVFVAEMLDRREHLRAQGVDALIEETE